MISRSALMFLVAALVAVGMLHMSSQMCFADPDAKVATSAKVSGGQEASPVDLVKRIVSAFKGGKWILAVSLIIMLLTWVLNRTFLKNKIPSSVLPWVSAGLGVLSAIFTALVMGIPWWEALIMGLFTGTAASGLWSMVGTHLLVSKTKKAEQAIKKADAAVAKAVKKDSDFKPDKPSWID